MLEPKNELGVIVLFAQQCEKAGFEILSIQAAFPDALIKRGDVEYRAEFEFHSSNFYAHGHDPRKADLVICWQHDEVAMKTKALAFKITNELLNHGVIKDTVLPSRVENIVLCILHEHGIGKKKVHFRVDHCGWVNSLCGQARIGYDLLYAQAEEDVTCLRCKETLRIRKRKALETT